MNILFAKEEDKQESVQHFKKKKEKTQTLKLIPKLNNCFYILSL